MTVDIIVDKSAQVVRTCPRISGTNLSNSVGQQDKTRERRDTLKANKKVSLLNRMPV